MRPFCSLFILGIWLAGCGDSTTPSTTDGAGGSAAGAGGGSAGSSGTSGAAGSGTAGSGGSAAGSGGSGGSGGSTAGSAGSPAAGASGTGAAAGASGAPGGSGGAAGGSAGASGAAGGASGASGGSSGPLGPTAFGSYVELGDSISDMGGAGPFFYDLLYSNDDAAYPAWQGLDLKSKFGVMQHVHGAVAGATASGLADQIKGLPATLPGPVLISMTIGGNDITSAAIDVLNGMDQPDRDKFRMLLSAALTTLTTPDHFGPGVQVYLLESNIYDPSDGKGDFSKHMCPGALSFFPVMPTDPIFASWNSIVTDEVPKHGMGTVLPLHDTFYGHGVGQTGDSRWYFDDCIHPDKIGHHQIRRMYWKTLTGADGPM